MVHQRDIWHVKLSNGETRALSLDELDAAFHDGWIDERTLVLPAGAIRWAPLAEVAGLDETPAPVSSVPNSMAPLALDAESDADVQALRPRRGRKVFAILTTLVVVAGLGFAAFRARPTVQRALASRGGGGSARVEPKPVAPVVPAPPVAAPVTPAALPAVADAVPTMTTTALPNAPLTPAEEKKAAADAKKAKRARGQSVRK